MSDTAAHEFGQHGSLNWTCRCYGRCRFDAWRFLQTLESTGQLVAEAIEKSMNSPAAHLEKAKG